MTRLEQRTDAEVVVVASPRSGPYRDVAMGFGLGLSGVLLLIAVFVPVSWDPIWLPAEMVVLLFAGTWAAEHLPWLMRLLTTRDRRSRQVVDAAAAAFHQDQVHATRARTGLLIYLSVLEQQVEIIPDHGLDARIPRAAWNGVTWDAHSVDAFVQSLEQAGEVLARYVPALDGDNPDELPNAPRIRR